ncbi:MAG TPA: SEC-C domain-containing protein [Bryobacteraceae bacterium]|jgi:transposase
MATDSQIAANRANAQASTGPATAAGKVNSSRNAFSSGLFSQGDFVRPDEHEQYTEFCGAFTKDLAPQGAIELTLSAEMIHAAWRLRRCSAIEATLTPANGLDPIADEASEGRAWRAVDRARAQATRTLHRTIAELRRIQTERQHRAEFLPKDFDRSAGLASFRDVLPSSSAGVQRRLLQHKLGNLQDGWDSHRMASPDPSVPAQTMEFTKRTQSAAPIVSRNAPCTCGSRIKFKRCCGKGAPPFLMNAPLRDSQAVRN